MCTTCISTISTRTTLSQQANYIVHGWNITSQSPLWKDAITKYRNYWQVDPLRLKQAIINHGYQLSILIVNKQAAVLDQEKVLARRQALASSWGLAIANYLEIQKQSLARTIPKTFANSADSRSKLHGQHKESYPNEKISGNRRIRYMCPVMIHASSPPRGQTFEGYIYT